MFRISLLLAVALAFVGHYTAARAQKPPNLTEIRVATGEWPPFSSEFYFAAFTSYGRAAEIVRRAFLNAGFDAKIEFNSFGASYGLAKAGEAQAAFPYYWTRERENEMFFSAPLLKVTDVIFYNSDLEPSLGEASSLEDLEPYKNRARFVESYCYVAELQKALQRECKTESRSDEADWRDLPTEIDAFKALLDDRTVVMLPAAKEVGERILQTWFSKEREHIKYIESDKLQWPREVFLVAPRRNGTRSEELVARFDDGLRALKESGEYAVLESLELQEDKVLREVRLGDPGTFPLVVARKERDSAETIVLPRGTTAQVVSWSSDFLTPSKATLPEQLREISRVMIMSGPQRGQLLWVQNVFIELP